MDTEPAPDTPVTRTAAVSISAPTAGAGQEESMADPWDKFGWVMATVWLLFLAFPLLSVLQADLPWAARLLAAAAIVLFAAVYIAAFVRMGRTDTNQQATRVGVAHLALMTVLVIAVIPIMGPWVLSMVVFLVALSMFALPLRWSAAVLVLALGLALVWPALRGLLPEMWFFSAIILAVGVGNGVVRVVNERQSVNRTLMEERQLVAERDRVARDVHDVLGHSLTVITVKAELAERLLADHPERAREELAQVQALSREALAEVRATVAGLRTARLEDELSRARTALAGAGIEADLPADISEVDPRHRMVLAWVLRELITNVVRHSGATRCRVHIGPSWLQVTDDGVGMDAADAGNGLRGVAERIGCGSLRIGTGPQNRGTTVTAVLDPDNPPAHLDPSSPAADSDEQRAVPAPEHTGSWQRIRQSAAKITPRKVERG
ncbi:MAG TPA: sensor histidine kinase [Beutenbergiaceae bacterium]|nr:sensor histidine kinase [Beutenbergiaceae bacterium]